MKRAEWKISSIAVALALILGLTLATSMGIASAGWPVAVVALLGVAVIVIIVIAVAAARRSRTILRAKLNSVAERHGLRHHPKTDASFHRSFGDLPGLPGGGKVNTRFSGMLDDRELHIFDHCYMIHTGHAAIPIQHTAYITSAPEWPMTTIAPRNWFQRWLHKLGRRSGLELEIGSFNRTYRLRCADQDFALVLLSPEMQKFLLEHREITWHIASGQVAMIYRGALKLERVDASLQRLRQFWSHVPDELDAW